MGRVRGIVLEFLVIFGLFFTASGCVEYNRLVPSSEQGLLTNVVQLTDGFARAGEASLSHDGRWLVFRAVKTQGGQYQVFLAKVAQSEAEMTGLEHSISITPATARSGNAAFSADGMSLIFASTAPKAPAGRFPPEMRVYRVDGWEGALAMAASGAMNLALHPLTPDPPYNGECSFSPDGKWICFTSTRNGNPNVFVMHSDGSQVVQITKTAGYSGGASFSPDGKSLVYQSDRDGRMQIYLGSLSFDSNAEITGLASENQLTHDDINTNPCLHPDGRHIVYATSRHGRNNYELYVMNTGGYHKTRLTFFQGADLLPAFSADGRYLIWTSKRTADGTTQVFAAKFHFPQGS